MEIPYRRIRTDIGHLYFFGSLEMFLGVVACFTLNVTGWQLIYYLPILVGFSGRGVQQFLRGVARSKALKGLGDTVVTSVTMDEIEKIKEAEDACDKLLLGYGFDWGPEHCQAYTEIANMPERGRHFEQHGPTGGHPYIHNIGRYLDKKAEIPQIHVMPEHTGIIGTTGVGKTRTFELIIAQLIKRGGPVIIFDPKSDRDLLDVTYQCCMAGGCLDRFEFLSLAHPQVSAMMNPFENYSTPGEIAGRITSIMPDTGNSRPFIDFCYDVLSGTATVLILIRKEISLHSLYKYSVLQRQELLDDAKAFRAKNQLPEMHALQLDEAIDQLEVKVTHDRAHYQKMTTSLLPVLGSLTSGNIGRILNPENPMEALSWDKIVRQNKILFISLASMKDRYVSTNVGKLFIQDMVSYFGTSYTRQSFHKHIALIIDEAATMVYEGFSDIGNKLRAAGVSAFFGLQTTADIEAALSEPVRRQIYALLANKIYMRILDTEQADELAETQGTCLVPKSTMTRNMAGTLKGPDVQTGELYRSGFAERVDLVEADLVPKPILSSLPRGHAILTTQGYAPIKLRIPLVSREGLPEFSFFDHVAGLYQAKEIRLPDDGEVDRIPTALGSSASEKA